MRFPAIRFTLVLALIFGLAFATPAALPARAADLTPGPCSAAALALSLYDDGGSGMSHGERMLVVKNVSRGACTVGGYPAVTFYDALHKPIPYRRAPNNALRRGRWPSLIELQPGDSAQAMLRWTEANVFDDGSCRDAVSLDLVVSNDDAHPLHAPLIATICGDARGPILEGYWFARVPTPTPSPSP